MDCNQKGFTQCGGDTSSCLGPYPMAACLKFYIGCRLGRELFTLPTYTHPRHLLKPTVTHHSAMSSAEVVQKLKMGQSPTSIRCIVQPSTKVTEGSVIETNKETYFEALKTNTKANKSTPN